MFGGVLLHLGYQPSVVMFYRMRSWLLTLFLVASPPCVYGQSADSEHTGTLTGRTVDTQSERPLVGANVYLPDLERGAATDANGRFTIDSLPVGTHTVRVSMMGYRTDVYTSVVVTSGRPAELTARLTPEAIEEDEVTVEADYFSSVASTPTSVRGLRAEEIRRAPGAATDIQRVMQSMPGVVFGDDERNDLIVRGGSPRENMTLLDGFEVPTINHFATQGATGGPISMLDTDFLDDATFHTGGFGAQYGGYLSSVLDIRLREGSRESFGGSADVSMAGAGGSLEGPLPLHNENDEPRGSWFVGARRSYLDLVQTGIGLTAVPQYGSMQGKAVMDLSPRDRLTVIGLGGYHSIHFERDLESDDRGADTDVDDGGNQVVGGLAWQRFWDAGVTTLRLSTASTTYRTDVRDAGDALETRNRSRETTTALRFTSVWDLADATTLQTGGTLRLIDYRHNLFSRADTLNTGVVRDEIDVTERTTPAQNDAYVHLEQDAGPLTLTGGLRLNHFSLSDHATVLSPRLSARVSLTDQVEATAAWGHYHQWPELVWYSTTDTAQNLRPTRATHWVAGLEWQPRPAWKLTLEGYRKAYSQVPVFEDRPMMSPINEGDDFGVFSVGALDDSGTARSHGIEAFVQRRLTDVFYTTVSFTLSDTRYTPLDEVQRPSSFDIRHVLDATVGIREMEAGDVLGLLGGSVRIRYMSGQPTTPFDIEASEAMGRGIIDTDQIHEERLPNYLRLDLRIDRRENFSWGALTSYVEIQNATGRRNVSERLYNDRINEVEEFTHWGRFFVGGIKLEW